MSAKKTLLCIFVLFVSLMDCDANWLRFWRNNSGTQAKTPWRELTPETEHRFEYLVNRRNAIRVDITMLRRMLEETQVENDKLNLELKLAFGVNPEMAYRFDQTGKALCRMQSRAKNTEEVATGDDSEDGFLDRVLSEQDASEFLKLVSVRQQHLVVLQGLEILNKQKLGQWEKVSEALLREFGVQRDQNYHYDKDERLIYRLTNKNAR